MFIAWLEKTYDIQTPDMIRKEYLKLWQDHLLARKTTQGYALKPATINGRIGQVKSFLCYLAKQGYDFPHAKLQTYEKVFLGITRPSDIKGEKIPGLYQEFLYEGNGRAMYHVLSHSVPDMITMALMYREFDEEMILPLPHYHEQASLFEDDPLTPNMEEAPF